MNILLLMMGGSGTRFGADIPKQYILIKDVPIFAYILAKYSKMPEIDKIVIVSHKDWIPYVEEWTEKMGAQEKVHAVVAGGATRSESVYNGLSAAATFADKEDVVLIHDATHPYVDVEGTKGVIAGVKKYGGATLGQCQYDTVYQMDANRILKQVVPRSEIVSGASPEAFTFGAIYDIYTQSTKEELESMTSAGAMALAHGITMEVVPANVINLKITYPGDMHLFRLLAESYFFPDEQPDGRNE